MKMLKEFLKNLFGKKVNEKPEVVNEEPVQSEPEATEESCEVNTVCEEQCVGEESQAEEAPKKKRRGRPRKKKVAEAAN